jgi:hypothetical protein
LDHSRSLTCVAFFARLLVVLSPLYQLTPDRPLVAHG